MEPKEGKAALLRREVTPHPSDFNFKQDQAVALAHPFGGRSCSFQQGSLLSSGPARAKHQCSRTLVINLGLLQTKVENKLFLQELGGTWREEQNSKQPLTKSCSNKTRHASTYDGEPTTFTQHKRFDTETPSPPGRDTQLAEARGRGLRPATGAVTSSALPEDTASC